MTKILTALLLGAIVALPLAGAAKAADAMKDAIDQFEDRMKGADEASQVSLIEQFAKAHPEDEDAAKAISRYFGDRSKAVQVAAIRAVGSYKDRKFFGPFMAMIKRSEDEPEVLAAVLEAIGELGDKRAKKELIDTAKKWLPKDARVSKAAIIGIGKIPAKDNVDELIKLMDMTYPSAPSGSGKTISAETRKTYADARPAILEALSILTGWDFESPRAWSRFWENEGRRWKPGKEQPDLTKIDEWEDPGYGFRIEKPSDLWVFTKPEGTRISIQHSKESVIQAQVYVQAYDMQNYAAMTADQKAAAQIDKFRNSWKDIKEESIVREPIRIGRDKGVMQSFTGMDTNGNTMKVREIFVAKDEFMYVVHGWVRTGLDEKLFEDIGKILDSFKLTF